MIALTAAAVLEELAQDKPQVLDLLALCRREDAGVWTEGPELHRRFARLLLGQAHPTLALEVAARGLDPKRYPDDPDLLYCRARALVNSGNITRADSFVRDLLDRRDLTPALRSDALSLAGRIRKDVAARTAAPVARTARFREAFDWYWQAYDLSGDTFPGINAASLALLSGQSEEARKLAVSRCRRRSR